MAGLKWITISRFAAQILTWANTFFVIRLISQADFGLAALAGLFANFLALINELGFSVALVQRQTRDRETLRHVFGALLAIGAALTLALLIAAPLLGNLVREPRVVPLIRLIAVQFLAMSFGVIPQSRLSMDMRFKQLSIVQICAALIGAAATLIVALNGGGAWSLVIGTVALTVSRTVLLNAFCPSLMRPRLGFGKIRQFAEFSGLVLAERSLWYWYMQIDAFVVGRVLGAAQLGVYAVGRQLTEIPLERAMEIINSVALPAFSRVKSDLEHVRRGYLTILRLGSSYAFPAFWGLAVMSDPLVRVVIGVKWIAAVPVIQILCVSMPLRMLNSFTSAATTSLARQDVNIKSLILATLVIPSCVVVGSRWGVQGVAAAWAIGFPFVYLFNAALVRGVLAISISEMATAIWPSAIAAAAMAILTQMLSGLVIGSLSPLAHLCIGVPFGAAAYFGILWLISRSSARETLEFARGVISRNR